MRTPIPLLTALALAACDPGGSGPADLAPPRDAAPDTTTDAAPDARPADAAPADAHLDAGPRDAEVVPEAIDVQVLLDGEPAAGVRVVQGGIDGAWFTDADGRVRVPLDLAVVGDVMVIASHPEARQRAEWIIPGIEQPVVLPLRRFGPDNPAYRFQDPGEPRRRNTTAQCGHCHLTINDAWFGSAHRESASNPVVHDLYAGTAAALDDPDRCAEAGGRWRMARLPGTDERGFRCFLGDGVLPTLDPACADGPCPEPARTGGCADCHAPAINGALGGRDLLEARAIAYDYGVSCDVCHRVEAIDPDGAPGIAGRLRLHRPSDPGPITLGAGGLLPLTFGPSHDSPNPRMGSVQRDHYRDGRICSGCHQLDAAPEIGALDPTRWPEGTLPIQSTWSEHQSGPLADIPCQSCHMPPEPGAANGADLQAFPDALVGIQAGWYRPPGSVRRHRWTGPRDADTLPKRAAAVFVERALADGRLEARVTVRNVGAGHAIPTGEPMRQMLLRVEARCGDAPLAAIDGDALPGWAGALDGRPAADDWTRWPGAAVGDVIRVVRRPGGFHDYTGPGPFGDGRFTPAERGLPIERVAGEATVTAVAPDGAVQLDRPLPAGDFAWRARGDALAGAAGFGFARVLTDAAGRAMVPHFIADDVRSDNRLSPGARWSSTHVFDAAGCADPTVRATLTYRAYPWWLRTERRWTPREIVMAEVVR